MAAWTLMMMMTLAVCLPTANLASVWTLVISVTVAVCLPTPTLACIDNPMDAVNDLARKQYQTTDEVLTHMETATPVKYANLLRVYGIYRACVEGGTGRWTDNVGTDGESRCPYVRTRIEDEDKTVTTRPQPPKDPNNATCAKDEFCHRSDQGCYFFGVQGSGEWCRTHPDFPVCHADGSRDYDCGDCTRERVRTDWCPLMCGYCKPQVSVKNSTTCAKDDSSCHVSPHGCVHRGTQGSGEVCRALGDYSVCRADGSRKADCGTCGREDVRTDRCAVMCGFCRPPPAENITTCAMEDSCHVSPQGCVYRGTQGSEEVCRALGDYSICRADGSRKADCGTCGREAVRTDRCPVMCGFCRPPPAENITTCAMEDSCHVSPQGCVYRGTQGSEEVCRALGDYSVCQADGSRTFDCMTCGREDVRTDDCSVMCGFCRPPPAENITTCAKDDNCHVSPQGCVYRGNQGSEEVCRALGDYSICRADGSRGYDCGTCGREWVRTDECSVMCGFCRPPPVHNRTTCARSKDCYESVQGCFHLGVQGGEPWCRGRRDHSKCRSDGSALFECGTCTRRKIRTRKCPIMCGFCRRPL